MSRPILLSMRVEDCPADTDGMPYGIPSVKKRCTICKCEIWRSESALPLDELVQGIYLCNQCAPDYMREHSTA